MFAQRPDAGAIGAAVTNQFCAIADVQVECCRDQGRFRLVRKKTSAVKSSLAGIERCGQGMIRPCRAKRRDPKTVFLRGARENVLKFADLVAAVDASREIVVLDRDASGQFLEQDLMLTYRSR